MASERKVRLKSVAKKAHVEVTPSRVRRINTNRAASLYYFQATPRGGTLRAYLVGFMLAQLGGIVANQPFVLWPSANVKTHLDTGRMKRQGKTYRLSSEGVGYFNDDTQAGDQGSVKQMMQAVKTGKAPEFYRKQMTPLAPETQS